MRVQQRAFPRANSAACCCSCSAAAARPRRQRGAPPVAKGPRGPGSGSGAQCGSSSGSSQHTPLAGVHTTCVGPAHARTGVSAPAPAAAAPARRPPRRPRTQWWRRRPLAAHSPAALPRSRNDPLHRKPQRRARPKSRAHVRPAPAWRLQSASSAGARCAAHTAAQPEASLQRRFTPAALPTMSAAGRRRRIARSTSSGSSSIRPSQPACVASPGTTSTSAASPAMATGRGELFRRELSG